MKQNTGRLSLAILLLLTGVVHGFGDSTQDCNWLGYPMASTHLPTQEKPLSMVIDAYRFAREGNQDSFLSLFAETDRSDVRATLNSLFTFWSETVRFEYTLAAECRAAGTEPARRGFLITAKSMDGISTEEESWANPFVLYAQKQGSDWKLTTRDLVPSVTEKLLQEVKGYQTSLYPSVEDVQRMSDEYDRKYIAMLEEKDFPKTMIIAEKEMQEQANQGKLVNTWDDWKRVYQAEMLSNSPAFSCLDPVQMDFSTPYAAWRSTMHAIVVGDVKALYEFADAGERAIRKELKMYQLKDQGKNLLTWKNLTWIVPLMSARTVVDGEEYILFKYRAEDPNLGREGFISFSSIVFRKQSDKYCSSINMEDSDFIRPHLYARPDGSSRTPNSFGMYPKWHEDWSKSQFPPWFYTIKAESKQGKAFNAGKEYSR